MVLRWITNRSFKLCGLPECGAVGYVADFVAIAGMHDHDHSRYARHSGLEKMYMRSVWDGKGKPLKHEIHGDIDRWYVCVFEVKISRADFLNTFGNRDSGHAKARMKPAGTAHWVVADKGVCKPEELPDFWGLLMPYGAGLTEKKLPKLNPLPGNILHSIAFDMLWLTMNFRISMYDHNKAMAEAIKNVHSAVIKNKPVGEILRRSSRAIKTCRGL